jgi:two-component system, chemotaxis family, CheB/CheR fusion protein
VTIIWIKFSPSSVPIARLVDIAAIVQLIRIPDELPPPIQLSGISTVDDCKTTAPASIGSAVVVSRFPIVGVGASAGGVEALEALFRPMPAEPGMAFVVIIHLGPKHESMLAEIIARYTAMPVHQIRDRDAVAINHIYVLRHEASLTITGGRLRLIEPGATRRERNPIDIFFSALAEDQGEAAIGIVLSGGGSDGTLGIKAIKERGGLTLAQVTDRNIAPQFSGMPSTAIASGLVDLALPITAMVGKLVDYARGFGGNGAITAKPGQDDGSKTAHREICQILLRQVGHDFANYKDPAFLRRVQRRMRILQLSEIESYIERLRQDADEVNALFSDLLINVTSFFRDAPSFAALEKLVIPRLFEGKGANDTVRVWVPGCATGEEAYSLAILLLEHRNSLRSKPKVQIFASDIDEAALAVARTGRYPAVLLKDVSPERLQSYFTRDDSSYLVLEELRATCVFSAHSIIRDPPFARLDLISCRNVLIYLNTDLQDQVIPHFAYVLNRRGLLFLGMSESPSSRHTELFSPLDKKHHIFQRRDHVAKPLHLPMLIPDSHPDAAMLHQRANRGGGRENLRRQTEERVLDRHAPAYVVVNRDGDIVHFSARTGKYLEDAVGPPSRQLLAKARKGLRLDLRAALREANEARKPVIRERIEIEIDDRIQMVTVKAEPLVEDDVDPLFLIVFSDVGPPFNAENMPQAQIRYDDAPVEELLRELRETRERLQSMSEEYESTIAELKSANERLVSVYEEVQSINEELETSKEEQQSVNEELYTVNAELSEKVEALDQANSDLKNVFESTEIATVFLDRHLVIRSFTPAVSTIFNLIPSDRGRPLTDIASNIDHIDLRHDIREVLDGREPIERRVSQRDGKAHHLMRLLPYRASDSSVDGVLATFIDITKIIAAEEHQRLLIAELNHRVRNMLGLVMGIATQTLSKSLGEATIVETFLDRIHALARAYELLSRGTWGDVPVREIVAQQLQPYLTEAHRVTTEGASVSLRPKATLALGMVIHELATNAMKHGALSVPEGQVDVTWSIENGEGGRCLILNWREAGGPAVGKPIRKGFGSELIARTLAYELEGEATIDFAAEGLRTTLIMPFTPQLGDMMASQGESHDDAHHAP